MTARPFQLCGLGNAIVDIFLELDEPTFVGLNYEKGTMRLVEPAEQAALIQKFQHAEPRLASGGSVANSLIGFTQLGGKAAFIGCVGDDRYGLFYQQEFEQLGIEVGNPAIVGAQTGTCVSLITPDAERTMRTSLAISSHLAAKHVEEARIKNSEWLFIEGYVFANPETGQGAIRRALELAKQHGVRVAVTCSDAFIPQVFGEPFREALKQTDLLFCNHAEACALTGQAEVHSAFVALQSLVPHAVVTDGPQGAHLWIDGQASHVPAFECTPKDLTGAGDMFAGAFLYGYLNGVPPTAAARAANYLSMKVITQIGARLHSGTREYWEQAIGLAQQ